MYLHPELLVVMQHPMVEWDRLAKPLKRLVSAHQVGIFVTEWTRGYPSN